MDPAPSSTSRWLKSTEWLAEHLRDRNVAIVDGFLVVTPPDGGAPTSTRYTAVHVKQDGRWFLESVREAVATPPSHQDNLQALDWLVGDWVDEAEKGEVARVSFEWAENHNFIVSTFVSTLKDVPLVGVTQWIGWDAAAKQIAEAIKEAQKAADAAKEAQKAADAAKADPMKGDPMATTH